jgi:hypothetical protein
MVFMIYDGLMMFNDWVSVCVMVFSDGLWWFLTQLLGWWWLLTACFETNGEILGFDDLW